MPGIKQRFARLIGKQAENHACDYLEQQGLRLITENYHCRGGEIDLVMRDGDEWVFVEVKYRTANRHGSAVEMFDQRKRRRVEKAVGHFLQQQGLNPAHSLFRLDLIAIDGAQIQWLKHI